MPFMAISPDFMPASISAIRYCSMYKGLHGEGGLRDGHMWQNPTQPWWLHIIVRSCCITYIHMYTVYAACGVLTNAHGHTCAHQYRPCSTYICSHVYVRMYTTSIHHSSAQRKHWTLALTLWPISAWSTEGCGSCLVPPQSDVADH